MDKKAQRKYKIQYSKTADKFLRLHEDIRSRYEDAIHTLLVGEHPESVNVKLLKGKRNEYYRIRLGNYRIVYTVDSGNIIVICTLLAGSRGDVYKKMSGLD